MTRKLTVPKQVSYADHLPSIQETEDDINTHVIILRQDLSWSSFRSMLSQWQKVLKYFGYPT